MHRRATLNVENRLRFEMHDSLAFFPPRSFRFDVRLPREPQLEFFHAVDPCRYGTDGIRASIRLSAKGRVLFERSLDLRSQSNRLSATPWTEVRVPLPVHPTQRARHVVVDSSGGKVYGEVEWKVRQHGWSKRRTWRKLYLGVDEATHKILSARATSPQGSDAGGVTHRSAGLDGAGQRG